MVWNRFISSELQMILTRTVTMFTPIIVWFSFCSDSCLVEKDIYIFEALTPFIITFWSFGSYDRFTSTLWNRATISLIFSLIWRWKLTILSITVINTFIFLFGKRPSILQLSVTILSKSTIITLHMATACLLTKSIETTLSVTFLTAFSSTFLSSILFLAS